MASGARADSTAAYAPSPELTPVGNRPLLSHALDVIASSGITEAALLVDARERRAVQSAVSATRPAALRLRYVDHHAGAALSGALSEVADFLDGGPFVVHLADSLTGGCLQRYVEMLGDSDLDALLLLGDGCDSTDGGMVRLTDGRLRRLLARGGPQGGELVSAGVYVFGPRTLELLAGGAPAGGGEVGVASILERLFEAGAQVGTQRVAGWWRYRPEPEALLDANRLVLDRLGSPPPPTPHTGDSRLEGALSIDPSARLECSTLRGPAAIGPRACVRHSYVGPYTAIGPDVVLEGVEVENSIILSGAVVANVQQRLDASIIGSGARVRREFRLPSALRLCVGEGADVSFA